MTSTRRCCTSVSFGTHLMPTAATGSACTRPTGRCSTCLDLLRDGVALLRLFLVGRPLRPRGRRLPSGVRCAYRDTGRSSVGGTTIHYNIGGVRGFASPAAFPDTFRGRGSRWVTGYSGVNTPCQCCILDGCGHFASALLGSARTTRSSVATQATRSSGNLLAPVAAPCCNSESFRR